MGWLVQIISLCFSFLCIYFFSKRARADCTQSKKYVNNCRALAYSCFQSQNNKTFQGSTSIQVAVQPYFCYCCVAFEFSWNLASRSLYFDASYHRLPKLMATSYIRRSQYGKILFLTCDISKCRGIEPVSPKWTLAAILKVFVLGVHDSLNVRCTFDTSRCRISRESVVWQLNLVFLPVEHNQSSFKYNYCYRLVEIVCHGVKNEWEIVSPERDGKELYSIPRFIACWWKYWDCYICH